MNRMLRFVFGLMLVGLLTNNLFAQKAEGTKAKRGKETKTTAKSKKATPDPMVAYDAQDRRYYLLTWAKANGMRDPGGDRLKVMRLSQLPKGANPAIAPQQRKP